LKERNFHEKLLGAEYLKGNIMTGFLHKNLTARGKGQSPLSREIDDSFFLKLFCLKKKLRHKKVSSEQKKVEGSSTFFIRYVNFDQWNCFFFNRPMTLQKGQKIFTHATRKWRTALRGCSYGGGMGRLGEMG